MREVVLSEAQINSAFHEQGGSKRLDKLLDGRLGQVMETINRHLWPEVG